MVVTWNVAQLVSGSLNVLRQVMYSKRVDMSVTLEVSQSAIFPPYFASAAALSVHHSPNAAFRPALSLIAVVAVLNCGAMARSKAHARKEVAKPAGGAGKNFMVPRGGNSHTLHSPSSRADDFAAFAHTTTARRHADTPQVVSKTENSKCESESLE